MRLVTYDLYFNGEYASTTTDYAFALEWTSARGCYYKTVLKDIHEKVSKEETEYRAATIAKKDAKRAARG